MKLPSPSPLVQLTATLVALCGALVWLAALFFDAVPAAGEQQRRVRIAMAESLAVQVAQSLPRQGPEALGETLQAILARTKGARSAGVRRADGSLLLQAGPHEGQWQIGAAPGALEHQIAVPLETATGRWGQFEIRYDADARGALQRWLSQPLIMMLGFLAVVGTVVFGLYMRRALQHLDPASVIPERVQAAFDVMTDGVLVLDVRGRVLLSNRAFRSLNPSLADLPPGTSLSSVPWLAEGLPSTPSSHPWHLAIEQRAPNAGTLIEAGPPEQRRRLVINAAPVVDAGEHVRGCIVTLSDLSALHQAHAALNEAMQALAESKRQVEQQNLELQRLATRDPMTGCLNRRAFLEAVAAMRRDGGPEGLPVAVVVLDIDHFKSVNDTHGHGIGDRVIQEVARQMQAGVRSSDLVCRWGGEEFCLALPGAGLRLAMELADRLRQNIERQAGPGVSEVPGLRVTASLGVHVGLLSPGLAFDGFVENADQALYQAKRSGRNRVIASPTSPIDASAVEPADRPTEVEPT